MKLFWRFSIRYSILSMILVAFVWLSASMPASAQSSGPSVDECSGGDNFPIESTACIYGDSSGLTAYEETDLEESSYWDYYVGQDSEAQIWDGNTLVADSGDPYCDSLGTGIDCPGDGGQSSYASTSIGAVNIGDTYSVSGTFWIWYDPSDMGNTSDANWEVDGGDSASVQVTAPTVPTISVASSGSPSIYGSSVTFTASVTTGDTNTVTFYNGSTTFGTATPSGGMARLTTNSLPVGSDSITASIAAGGDYSSATSSAITQVVNQVVHVYDSGTIQLLVNGIVSSTTSYGQNSTSDTIAAGLAGGVTASSPVTLTEVNGSLYVVSKTSGASTDYSYTLQTTSWDSGDFSQPSFLASPISGNLTGGANANSSSGTVYSFSIPSYVSGQSPTGYDAVGNIVGYSDSVNGTYGSLNNTAGFSYDSLNRLTGAEGKMPNGSSVNYCWAYDSFGNRTMDANVSCSQNPTPTQGYNANNQMTGGLIQYDASGDVTVDATGGKQYLYDGEGRICAVQFVVNGTTFMTGYIYNAEGQRVSKGSIAQWSCDPSTNGFQASTDYYIGPDGNQLTEIAPDGTGNMVAQRTYVYANGQSIAEIDGDGTHFRLTDWIGNLRVTTDSAGVQQGTWSSLPFGEAPSCPSSSSDCHYFTGKERDTESGNDYFGARYYASTMGRFLSPDWSDKPEAVPYADLENPQSLNLYGYAGNNPLRRTDADGHCTVDGETHGGVWCFLHSLGLVETQHEQANDLRNFYNGLVYYGPDGKPVQISKLSDTGIIQFDKDHRDAFSQSNWAVAAGVSVTTDKLQHIYDRHAGDFGLSGNKNPEQLQKLDDAIAAHVNDPDTRRIPGQYRGQDADIYLNSRTNNVVVTDKSGNVVAGFKASPAQVGYINSTGRLN